MSFPISQFYPLLLVLWGIVFWCRSRVFRATLLISLGLHAVFLVRLSGWGIDRAQPEEVISFTFVQGGDETGRTPSEEKIGPSPEVPDIAPQTLPKDSEAEREKNSTDTEKVAPPEESRVEPDLPRMDDRSLLDFSAHPLAESYRRQLQRLIAQYQEAPPEVLKEGFEGRVKVWFNLSHDGTLNQPVFVDAKIRSSHDTVNRAAIDSVRGAAKHFPPFPNEVKRAEIWFHVYVDYSNVRFPGD
jgi:hypothetical protein